MNNINLKMNSFKCCQYMYENSSFKTLTFLRNCSKNLESEPSSNTNSFMEKYALKIAERQKMSSQTENCKLSLDKSLSFPKIPPMQTNKSPSKGICNKSEIKTSNIHKKKDLNQIMKIEAVQEKSTQEIESIWKEYHRIKDGVYAVLPATSFDNMYSNLKEYSVFLFPLPRAQGYEFFMCQFVDQSCYFTSLLNYQALKENAPICLTVTYFTEFQKEKGIVLMRGEFDNSLKAHEAQCLTNQLQLYYGAQNEEKINLLWKFNKQPEAFNHMDLISNFESSFRN